MELRQQTPEPTPAFSEADLQTLNGEQQGELLAGKFKTPEELAKAYKELESKLGQSQQPETPQAQPEAPQVEPVDATAYGEVISTAVTEAGLNLADVTKEFTETGSLAQESFDALEKAGFPRNLVETYLEGLKARNASAQELADSQVKEIQDSVGGPAEYQKMIQWAAQALTPDEQEAFNSILNQGYGAAKYAISGLYAKYQLANGFEPKLLSGKSTPETAEKFNSQAEMLAAMKDERYAKDPHYRSQVEKKIGNSDFFGIH